MTRNDLPAPTQACLDNAVLRAYNLGIMPEAMLEQVASHLAVCQRCESVLESVGGTEDAFLQNLRQYLRDAPPLSGEGAAETGPELANNFRQPPTTRVGLGALPRRFGNYEVLENLAISGMSIVFKARQLHPNRLVALKVPRCAPLDGTEAFERFQLEIEAIAQLQHDHIVRIYECGEEEGVRYFSMEYMEEGSLAAKLAGSPLAERAAAQLVHTLARAVQFAHQQGIVHRDLKPGNVLLGAEGSVKLTDFGLAKWLDGDAGLTQSHAIMGTAKYMAPEQARGDSKYVGVLTDVYGLGTILYECLTGRAPFSAGSQKEVLHLVETSPPVAPSKLRRGLSRNLEAICLKCLEKSPARRYPSAKALADDLERWQRGDATLARPERWPARLRRTARRHRVLTTAIVLALLAAVMTPVAAYLRDPARQREDVERPLRKGKPITLIGETGKPTWFQVSTDPNYTKISMAPDKTFSVTAFKLGLVELLSDPQCERYRFSAEVRQDRGEPNGWLGIYIAHSKRFTASGQAVHEFCGISFIELHDLSRPRQPWLVQGSGPGNPVQFIIRRYVEPGIVPIDHTISGPWEHHFIRQPHTWRKLAIEVTPERIIAFWDGQLLGELSRTELMKRAQHLANGPTALPGVEPALPIRGALGLYLSDAAASFRSVVVEPLGGDQ